MTVRVVLADDHALVSAGLKMLLEVHADLRVVGTAAGGRAAVALVQREQPQVAVLDISMPDLDGIEATRLIRATCPHTHVVVLSAHDNAEHVYRALEAGAIGYLIKDVESTEVVAAVRAASVGRGYRSSRIRDLFVGGPLHAARRRSPAGSLSRREHAVLQFVLDGQTNAEAARQLHLSVKTVETYRGRLMQKLGVTSVPALVKFAVNHGLTQLR